MQDASGKFALVMLRAKQVRVHHKRTKHEYVFRISDDRIEAAECLLHPNHAAPVDPRDFREEAQAAAGSSRSVPEFPLMSSTSSPGPVGWQRNLTSSVADACAAPAMWQIEHTPELFQASRNCDRLV
jgi:hypothetical protein